MKFVKLFIISFFFCYAAQSQVFQPVNTPLKWKIAGFDSLFLPTHDTIKPRDKTKAWMTVKDTTLYVWKANKWVPISGGGGGNGELNSGTVAQIRALTTTTGRNYTSTDKGTGNWVDKGLEDGTHTDDGAIYIITANNHYLERANKVPVKLSWFAPNDGVTDARAGVQAAINYCNLNGIKQMVVDGDYYLSDSVIDRRGGTEYIGNGALLREESWGVLYPSIFTTYTPNKGSSFIIAPNKTGFAFDTAAVDPIVFKKIQFVKNGARAAGKTTAIAFRGRFSGPTWPFIVEECNFKGFNYAIKFESTTQQLVNFVQINRNAFSQNDECIFFNDIALAKVTSVGQRNLSWGFTFTHNKCHDNSRIVRGMFAKDLVTIQDNNGEGNIAYAAGGYPNALFDLEFSNATVEFKGNHFEGVTGVKSCIKVSSQFVLSNGNFQPFGGTTQNSEKNKAFFSGNNYDGITSDIKPIEALGCYVYNEDVAQVYGSGVFMAKSLVNSPTLLLGETAKTDGSVYKFEVNGTENRTINKNEVAWIKSLKYSSGNSLFNMNTPFGVRQMAYFSTAQTAVLTQTYTADWGDHIKYTGVTFLVNSSYKSDFLGNVLLYYSYTDNLGAAQSGVSATSHVLSGVPNGWSFITAYFPNPFPAGSTARACHLGLTSGELQDKAVLVGSDYTVFATEKTNPDVIPYFNQDVNIDNAGTFYTGQSFVSSDTVFTVTDGGTKGTLSGVTATGVNAADEFITVTNPANLIVGQRIKIGSGSWWVRNIEGTKVFLSDPIATPFSGATVSFKPPILQKPINIDTTNFAQKSQIIYNQSGQQAGANFNIAGVGVADAGFVTGGDFIGQRLTINNWLQYNAGQPSLFIRDQLYSRMHVQYFPGPNNTTAQTIFNSSVTINGPAIVPTGTIATHAVNVGQLTDSLNARGANTFILRNSLGTGDSIMKVITPGSHVAMKTISVTGPTVTSANTDSTLHYIIDGIITGVALISGNGSQTQFDLVGLDHTPTWIGPANPGNAVSVGVTYIEPITNGIRIHFATAPPSGSANVSLYYQYK